MTWQHWILAAFYTLGVVSGPTMVGYAPGVYTTKRVTITAVISLVLLGLLVWGES